MTNDIAARRFQIGDRVSSDRANGVVVAIDTDKFNIPHHRVDVRWDNGSKSYRPEDGLTRSVAPLPMTAARVIEAKEALGRQWGLDRPLHNSELARALRLTGRDPGRSVEAWSKGATPVSGPAAVAIEMMLAGALPPDPLTTIVRKALP